MPWSHPYPYLSVVEDGVEVEMNGLTVTCRNYDELHAHLGLLVEKGCVPKAACSSSIDFPEEYTDRPEVLEMVRKIWDW